jgi:hypothetical protein
VCKSDTTANAITKNICSKDFTDLAYFNDSLGKVYNCTMQSKTKVTSGECITQHAKGAICL